MNEGTGGDSVVWAMHVGHTEDICIIVVMCCCCFTSVLWPVWCFFNACAAVFGEWSWIYRSSKNSKPL